MTEVLIANDQVQPLQAMVKRYFPEYGWGEYELSLLRFPDGITTDGLLEQARKKLESCEDSCLTLLQRGTEAIRYAQRHAPEVAACRMRQVFAAYLSQVVNPFRENEVLGTLAVCGVNGLPPDHIDTDRFSNEETQLAAARQLQFLIATKQITSDTGDIETRLYERIRGRILNCGELAQVFQDVAGVSFRACRRRDVETPLPKSACPSLLCAEGDAFTNQVIGEMVFRLVYSGEPCEVKVLPLAKFSTKEPDQQHPLLPAEYTVYYQKITRGRVTEGIAYLDRLSVEELVKGWGPNTNVDLHKVREELRPSLEQTDIYIRWVGGTEPGYWNHCVSFRNPSIPSNQTGEYTVDPYHFRTALSGADPYPGVSHFHFNPQAMATSDVPCPRCTHLVIHQKIPVIAVTGRLSLRPDYYEPACLYTLLQSGVAVVHQDFLG